MRKASLRVLKALAAATTLALGCLAIVYSAEIVAFFGSYAMWIIAGLAVLTVLGAGVGLTLGFLLRKRGLRRGVPVNPAARRRLTAQ